VLPTCTPGNPVLASKLDQVEVSFSHELIEAATDPLVQNSAAWEITDGQNAWSYLPGEVGDLCNYQVKRDGPANQYWVQRIWSNVAAAAEQNPCIPAAASSYYFNVSPNPANIIPLVAGQSFDVQLTGWSTGPVPQWFVTPIPSYATFALQASIDKQTMNNGTQAKLSVLAPAGTPSGEFAALDIFSFGADDGSVWPLVFVVQ
jgi:hypothetical protein